MTLETQSEQERAGFTVMINHFMSKVVIADDLVDAANSVSIRIGDVTDPLRSTMGSVECGLDALSSATHFLGAATNSLKTLKLLTINDVSADESNVKVKASITVNGTAGLIRQVVECSSRALWLLSSNSFEQLSIRGFSAVWANAEEAVLYAEAIGSSEYEQKKANFAELLAFGKSKNWINEGGRRSKPMHSLGNATEILRKVEFDPGPLASALHVLGTKANNGEWVYRWLSGMAHGHAWVHSHIEVGQADDGMQLVWTSPDWVHLTLSISLAVEVVERTLGLLSLDSPLILKFHSETGENNE